GRQWLRQATQGARQGKDRGGLAGGPERRGWGRGASSLRPPLSGLQGRILGDQPTVESVSVQVDATAYAHDSASGCHAVFFGVENPPAELGFSERGRGRELRDGL